MVDASVARYPGPAKEERSRDHRRKEVLQAALGRALTILAIASVAWLSAWRTRSVNPHDLLRED